MAGSTLFNREEGQQEAVQSPVKALLRELVSGEFARDLGGMETRWSKETRSSTAEAYQKKESFYWTPLEAGNRLLGVMALGDRVGGKGFSIEDQDLLKTICSQTASSLLNLRLSENLRQAKEIEALQTMSAFMIHDLKNLGNTLSLTMENLPVHFENPEFRAEALRIIHQSVNKINSICRGLSLLRQKIELHPVETDLNQLVRQTLDSLAGSLGKVASKGRPPAPAFHLPGPGADPEGFGQPAAQRPGGRRGPGGDPGGHPGGGGPGNRFGARQWRRHVSGIRGAFPFPALQNHQETGHGDRPLPFQDDRRGPRRPDRGGE